jgi:DNA invertase Pin-like site-specific DNA recombinase
VAEVKQPVRCAIYTRKSTEEGLEQDFNSLQAQREAAEAYILSQRHAGWTTVVDQYDDGGFTGANLDRPSLKRLMADLEARKIDCVVVYKVDRLSRSLMDFAQLMSLFERHGVSFVSVTQEFNTTTSLGRLTLHILLSFAQFEREIIGERTRDKVSAARRKGKWTGGCPILGYSVDPQGGRLVVNPEEAGRVKQIFAIAARARTLAATLAAVNRAGLKTKEWTSKRGAHHPGRAFHKMSLRGLVGNALYTGVVVHKGKIYPGEHEAIIERRMWEKVNRRFEEGGTHQRGRRHGAQAAMLAGVLYCSCGARMAATFAVSHGRRYGYYVCEAAARHDRKKESLRPRVARADLETSLVRQLEPVFGKKAAGAFEAHVERATFNAVTREVTIELRDQQPIQYVLPIPIRPGVRAAVSKTVEKGRVPRVSRLMALAIKFQESVRAGRNSNYAEIARLGRVTRSRLSQILSLNHLAPSVQEALLFLPRTTSGRDPITEKSLRQIACEVDWSSQRKMFQRLSGAPNGSTK